MNFSRLPLFRLVAGFVGLLLASIPALAQTITAPGGTVGEAYVGYTLNPNPRPAVPLFGATGLPPGLAMNTSSGVIAGTPTTAGVYVGTVSVTDTGTSETNSADISITIAGAANTPTIVTSGGLTKTGKVDEAFTGVDFDASDSPTSFNITGLPPGLSANSTTGLISGTPTTIGSYSVTVSANNNNGTGSPVVFTFNIGAAATAPVINNSTTTYSVATNAAFSHQISTTGAVTVDSYSASGLPTGVTIDTNTGAISGNPSVAGIYTIGTTATAGGKVSATVNVTLTVGTFVSITGPSTASRALDQSLSITFTTSGTPTSFNFSGVPAGLSGNATTGVLSGTPSFLGTSNITVSANSNDGAGPTSNFTLNIGNRPVVTNSTLTASGTEGVAITSYQITASNTPTSFAATPLPAGLAVNGSGLISGTPTTPGTTNVSLTATNAYGTSDAKTLVITIASAIVAPTIATQPVAPSGTVLQNSRVEFTVVVNGTAPTYQWMKGGVDIPGATSATYVIASAVKATHDGNYSVRATNTSGSVTSNAVTLTITTIAPTVASISSNQSVDSGATVNLAVTAAGSSPFTYQWRKKGVDISGATNATLTLTNVGRDDLAAYSVKITGPGGNVTSQDVKVTVNYSRLTNVSVRALARSSSETLIVGFNVTGEGSFSKEVLIRGMGPSLTQFPGIDHQVNDTELTLYRGFPPDAVLVGYNDDWNGNAAIAAASDRLKAFAPISSKDAMLLQSVSATTNQTYSVHLGAKSNPGTSLVEVYDSDTEVTTSRISNISARTGVSTGADLLFVGFYINGSAPKKVLIRGVGPRLGLFGLTGLLTDPKLELFNSAGTKIDENDNWASTTQLEAAMDSVGAFSLERNSKDAAILITLPPGSYSAQLSGVGGTTGVGLIEVYDVP